ncbi:MULTISPECIES: hypothetical protein [Actinokineospora]|uniref:Uncharacterized protein n=1 Tax=Actinokineospora fastidiosa TaxID=1816 RepID=A0A918GE15_9PSEU|nr:MULTISPECIES: hypothetical protein [Actinokineospora]UVS79746.1 hypothetical protein Actkin_03496 [Actinokineospora sp. UTMC 2448]GGS30704.1 hypothetical protein GCM10010171_25380 [Actinokineospora fastidiosa]
MQNTVDALRQRIHANAERLAAPTARAAECQDTASLAIGSLGGVLNSILGGLSDRTIKRDVVEVVWTR